MLRVRTTQRGRVFIVELAGHTLKHTHSASCTPHISTWTTDREKPYTARSRNTCGPTKTQTSSNTGACNTYIDRRRVDHVREYVPKAETRRDVKRNQDLRCCHAGEPGIFHCFHAGVPTQGLYVKLRSVSLYNTAPQEVSIWGGEKDRLGQ